MARPALALSLIALAFGTAGCGERTEPLGDLAQPYPITTRGAGDQPITVRRAPDRIVALDAGSAELLAALGAGARLVGVPAAVKARGATEVVRPTGQIDLEAVRKLDPDLIVATPSTDRVDVSHVQRDSPGASVYIQPAGSIEDVERAILELGSLIGEPVKARKLAGSIRRAVAEVDRRLVASPPVTVFVDTGFFITVPERSLLGELVRRAHGENVAAHNAGLGPFDVAELRRLDPEVYLATSDSRTSLETLRRNPKTRGLSAVQEGRFAVLDASLATRAGPRIAKAFAAVAAALHPDAFR